MPVEATLEPAHELIGDGGVPPREKHQHRARIGGEDAREQHVVVGMDFERRLRTQEQRRFVRQRNAVALNRDVVVMPGRNFRLVTRYTF